MCIYWSLSKPTAVLVCCLCCRYGRRGKRANGRSGRGRGGGRWGGRGAKGRSRRQQDSFGSARLDQARQGSRRGGSLPPVAARGVRPQRSAGGRFVARAGDQDEAAEALLGMGFGVDVSGGAPAGHPCVRMHMCCSLGWAVCNQAGAAPAEPLLACLAPFCAGGGGGVCGRHHRPGALPSRAHRVGTSGGARVLACSCRASESR
jgi:hypothetical protein